MIFDYSKKMVDHTLKLMLDRTDDKEERRRLEKMIFENRMSYHSKVRRILTSLGMVLCAGVLLSAAVLSPSRLGLPPIFPSPSATSAIIVVTLLTVAVFLLVYLREAGPSIKANNSLPNRLDSLERKLESQTQKLAKDFGKALISPTDRKAIVDQITKELQQTTTSQLIETLKAESAAARSHTAFLERISEEHSSSVERLENAIYSLQNRANVNLVFGIILSVAGVGILWQTLTMSLPGESGWEFARAYLPRLSLVLIIEIFSYFFLNLYKSNLSDTRYFHNELTNLSNKRIALIASIEKSGHESLDTVISDFSKTERNNTLSKEQTTYELAKAKLESESAKNLTGLVEKLLQSMISQKRE